MKNKILKYIKENYGKRLRKVTLRRALCHSQEDKDAFKVVMRELFKDNTLSKGPGGQLVMAAQPKPEAEYMTGKITIKECAFGFVDVEDNDESLFIPPGKTGCSFGGDIVKVLITDRSNSRGPVGVVVEIVSSTFTHIFGQLVFERNKYFARPLRPGTPNVELNAEDVEVIEGLNEGDWVKVELGERNLKKGLVYGKVTEKAGDAGDLDAELDAVISEYDLEPLYTAEDEKSAARLKERPIARRDLRSEVIMTIDPVDAKDFDDALSVHEHDDPNIITIGVHIADVAAYISPNGVWQKRIRQRCFTAYLPGRMLPMLPKVLVSKRCSLNENEEKPAHTGMLHIDRKTGKMVDFERFHSTINVRKRLNYEEVQEFADNGFKNDEWADEVTGPIKELYELSRVMRKWRREVEKFIPLEAPEVRVMCDQNTMELTGLKHEIAKESNQLVEEFMLAANVAVARELSNKQLPGLYRVHPEPDPEAVSEFSANAIGIYGLNTGDLNMRTNCVNFLNGIKELPEHEVVSFDFLRMMQRALYSEEAALHYGLGKGLYSHFTSPIRRMSDLIVHQQLWEFENGKKILSKKACQEEALNITEKESNIDEAYRAAGHRFKLYYIQQEMAKGNLQEVECFISKITNSAVKVFIQAFGMYCTIRMSEFDDDYYSVDPLGRFIKGSKTGKQFNCGDKLQVAITQINFARRELKLAPILGGEADNDGEKKEHRSFKKEKTKARRKKDGDKPKKSRRISADEPKKSRRISADEPKIEGVSPKEVVEKVDDVKKGFYSNIKKRVEAKSKASGKGRDKKPKGKK
ncbi:MAG: VacB/RNase II family 3'-5' exoribonuclease [Lentisphaeraceae bacterium]|nr:VacB/RNase II family 3'-5' exoribonuclease [Lentisphaeraceae bacterium]